MSNKIESKIIEFVNKIVSKKELVSKKDHFIDWGILTNKEEKEIFKITGINVNNYKRTFDLSGVNHALKHTNISAGDFALIPIIIKDYDFIACGKKPNSIVYKKIIGNEYYYVEEIRTGRKKLVIKTLYKRKKRLK